jgi:hypothetical protein
MVETNSISSATFNDVVRTELKYFDGLMIRPELYSPDVVSQTLVKVNKKMSVNASLRHLKEDMSRIKGDVSEMRYMLKKLVSGKESNDSDRVALNTIISARDEATD